MGIRIALEQGSRNFVVCPSLLGWALFREDNISEGLQRMHERISYKRKWGLRFYYDYELLVFADSLLKVGKLTPAQEAIEEALDFIKVSGNRLFEAEANRIKAVWLTSSAGGTTREVDVCLLRAIEIAKQQGARMFHLRSATALARLWREQGRSVEARDLLAPVYRWFTEGFDTIDLKDAKALLDQLNA